MSIRELNAVAVIDLDMPRVVWLWGPNNTARQHSARILDRGTIILFDNGVDSSRVIEVNPATYDIVWEFPGDSNFRFFSETVGSGQAVPNGNVLITDTHGSRAFEVTRDRRIVWEWRSPHRTGRSGELVASLFPMTRVDRDSVPFLRMLGNR